MGLVDLVVGCEERWSEPQAGLGLEIERVDFRRGAAEKDTERACYTDFVTCNLI